MRTVDPWRGWVAVRAAWVVGLLTWVLLYPWFMWDYLVSLPAMMLFASAAGPVMRLGALRSRCRRCGLELDGSYERSLAEGTQVAIVQRTPELVLGSAAVEAGTPIRGRLIVPAVRPYRRAFVRVRSCIRPVGGGPRRELAGPRIAVGTDGGFVLTAPRHPVSGAGELVTVSHAVEAAITYRRGPRTLVTTEVAVLPRTVRARPPTIPDVGYRAAAIPRAKARGLFDGLLPGDVPGLLGERQLGRELSALWADGMSVSPGARRRGHLVVLGSLGILGAGLVLAMSLPISPGTAPIIVLAAAVIALMAWDHFRPRHASASVAFEQPRIRLRVSGAVALSDAVHVRVEVRDGTHGEYRAELVRREHTRGQDLSSPERDSVQRVSVPLTERDDGELEAWLDLPADAMPTLVDAERHSVRWSVQVRSGEELVAEHPVCVLPVRLKAS